VAQALVRHVGPDGSSSAPDDLVVEEPLEIRLDGQPVATTMRSPGHDFELAAGFCLADGLLGGEPVAGVRYCDGPCGPGATTYNTVNVRTGGRVPVPAPRLGVVSSSCGACGSTAIDDLCLRLAPVDPLGALDPALVAEVVTAAGHAAPVFARTGAAHAAAAFSLATVAGAPGTCSAARAAAVGAEAPHRPDPARPDGLVLAGGRGARFGRPKATVVLDGLTLVERAVTALTPHCGRVLVVGRPDVPLPVPSVDDRPGPDCPLNALATGLAALKAEEVLVLACDLPGAGPVLQRLAAAPSVAVDPAGRVQPLCARYPRAAALVAAEELLAAGTLRLLPLLDHLGAVPVPASLAELRNVTFPDDLLL